MQLMYLVDAPKGHYSPWSVWCRSAVGLPDFTAQGLLPSGVHDATVDDVHESLVAAFDGSVSREPIFRWWREHRAALDFICPVAEQWVDGSFVTAKPDPADIDIVTVFDGEDVDALPVFKQVLLRYLLNGADTKNPWLCDSYVIVRYPEGDVRFQQTQDSTSYWTGWFGHTSDGVEKGYVRVP